MTTTWLIGHLGILIDFTTSPWQFTQPSIDKDLYDKDMTSSQQNLHFHQGIDLHEPADGLNICCT
jgi:hypothetical protein